MRYNEHTLERYATNNLDVPEFILTQTRPKPKKYYNTNIDNLMRKFCD